MTFVRAYAVRFWRSVLPLSFCVILVGCNARGDAAPPAVAAPIAPPAAAPPTAPVAAPSSSPPPTAREAWPPVAAAPPKTSDQIKIEDHLEQLVGTVQDALQMHAATFIPCPKDQIKMRWVLLGRPHNPSESMFADGCGQRVVYGSSPAYGTSPPYPEFYVVSRFAMPR